jgi:hypothetical protein
METPYFFYKLYSLAADGSPAAFLGNAFPIAPNGCMMTCRHVVDVSHGQGASLAIFDNEANRFVRIEHPPIICTVPDTDMAVIPNALGRPKAEFFPILTARLLHVGESVYSYGSFSIGGALAALEDGYFSGKIVSFFQHADVRTAMLTLPYAIIEGLSGSPVLTYHSGPKLVGMATGNRIARILAAETMEYRDQEVELRETINRIVEFGMAMHAAAIAAFISSLPECAGVIVTDQNVSVPHLD